MGGKFSAIRKIERTIPHGTQKSHKEHRNLIWNIEISRGTWTTKISHGTQKSHIKHRNLNRK